ncbi:RGS1-HXK1-interacting protein 1, partial [Linum perenne]
LRLDHLSFWCRRILSFNAVRFKISCFSTVIARSTDQRTARIFLLIPVILRPLAHTSFSVSTQQSSSSPKIKARLSWSESFRKMADGSDESQNNNVEGAGGNWVNDLQRTVVGSKESVLRSASSFGQSSSIQFHSLQNDYVPHAISNLKTYEDAFLTKLKDGLTTAKEHPAACLGVVLTSSLLLMRGPRRFLLRQTFRRFESEETRFHNAEKNVKDFVTSVDLMKKESKKLLERAALAEKDMKHGHTELRDAGNQIQRLATSAYKVERQATDLVDGLREIPGREALKLRLEVSVLTETLIISSSPLFFSSPSP